jgi:dephospho-CoA kinase
MLIIGVTGGIACGKSTVLAMLAECGAGVISADRIAHRLLWRSSPCFSRVVNIFGDQILTRGRINRQQLGTIIFRDEQRRRQLEAILHPAVKEVIEARCRYWASHQRYRIVAVEIPLLFEAGWESMVDRILVVRVSPAEQERRVVDSLHLTPAEARRRIRAQMPIDAKVERADAVIDNQLSPRRTRAQVRKLWKEWMKLKKQSTKRKMM